MNVTKSSCIQIPKNIPPSQSPTVIFIITECPGLKNAPATFQRMINQALAGLIGKQCFVYLDDIIIFRNTIQEHNQNLVIIFLPFSSTHERNWIKITTKREYLKPELEYLRHLIIKDGVKPNPNEIKTIKDFRITGNPTEVKSFLSLTGYYRKFIGNFSKIAKSLTNLTKEGTLYH